MGTIKAFFAREISIFLASVAMSVVWFLFVSWCIGAADDAFLFVGKVLCFVLPVTCLFESIVLSIFAKRNSMMVLDNFLMIGILTILPLSYLYFWFVGEDTDNHQTTSTVAFFVLAYGLPCSIFQNFARKMVEASLPRVATYILKKSKLPHLSNN